MSISREIRVVGILPETPNVKKRFNDSNRKDGCLDGLAGHPGDANRSREGATGHGSGDLCVALDGEFCAYSIRKLYVRHSREVGACDRDGSILQPAGRANAEDRGTLRWRRDTRKGGNAKSQVVNRVDL